MAMVVVRSQVAQCLEGGDERIYQERDKKEWEEEIHAFGVPVMSQASRLVFVSVTVLG